MPVIGNLIPNPQPVSGTVAVSGVSGTVAVSGAGFHTNIEIKASSVNSNGTGSISYPDVYVCPPDTVAKVKPIILTDNVTNTVSGITFYIIDFFTGNEIQVTTPVNIAFTAGVYKAQGWTANHSVFDPTTGVYPKTTIGDLTTSDDAYAWGKYDPITNELILTAGDKIKFSAAGFGVGGDHTTLFKVRVTEETR